MFALKTIHLEKKISNENQIILLFDLDSSCPCLYPLLYTMKFLRFQSISTQHADLIAIKFWYEFWYEKFSTSFCESFYSTSYNFEIIQGEIDNFIVYLEKALLHKPTIRCLFSNIISEWISLHLKSTVQRIGLLIIEP